MLKMILTNKSWKRLLATAVTLSVGLVFSSLRAQDARVVQGVVLDEKKSPIPGTTVQVKQTNISTSTTNDGRFTLRVPADKQVLIFSYIGKVAQEVNIRNQTSVLVALKDSVIGLEDVVVVGYGRQKKKVW
ncbi:carboxypeptidase-like regulatory domain-containing protein [Paraflavitalea speifideaquila]|uniref:carboxypeptidase-like regulatory domain-containing protein n=1 Tax=Paraflavitalea speifideaquila TaxID=3076558 RepID=UPI0028E2DE5F|nr:carboxypeptidase-like regulatory domain-containing protein [Paraflavitalea speifideiaquila]